MNSKIQLIDEFLNKSEECIEKKDSICAKKLVQEILSTFRNDIKYIWYDCDGEKDSCSNLDLLMYKLRNLKGDLELEIEKIKKNNSPTVSVNQNTNISIALSLEQTINLIESIPDEKLSPDEKEQLEGKLSKLGTEKEKSKVWDKTQSVLKWIADKGVEVGIAALPYIVEMIKNAK